MRVLSVDGGGYLALASASFLDAVEEHFNTRCRERFDLFCGTSAGAILVLALASGKTAAEVVELFERLGGTVFANTIPLARVGRWLRGLVASRYGNRQIREALKDTFKDLKVGDLKAEKKFVLVTAFSVTNGTPRIFKTDHSPHLTQDDGYLLRDIALASAAAPLYFPLVELQTPVGGIKELFCDGGVFANHPALLGYTEALYEYQEDPSQISVLSVSTPRGDLGEYESARKWFHKIPLLRQYLVRRGLMFWGSRLGNVFVDSTSSISHETLKRLSSLGGDRRSCYERFVLKKPPGVDFDIAAPEATATLKQVGRSLAVQNDTRGRLGKFFLEEVSSHG